MRFVLILFLLCTIAFAQFLDPPIHNMTSLNNEALLNLQNNYLNQLTKSTPTISNPVEAADAKLIKFDPAVDNFISAENQPKLIWIWAEKHAEEVNIAADLQSCTDGINLRFNSRTINPNIEFLFNGNNKTTNDSSTFSIDIPFSIEELSATPNQNITVSLSGEFNFLYDRTVLHYQYLPCSEGGVEEGCVATCELYSINSDIANFSRQFSSVLNYTVEGGNNLFFLTKPVLREQWYRNNKFNNLVFSNRVFYKSVILFNDEEISNTSIYNFDLYNDSLGIFYIRTTNKSEANITYILMKENTGLFSPHTLQQSNSSYSYLYQINTTYVGIGENNITLLMVDRFLNNATKIEQINSRMLSLDGSSKIARPSLVFNSAVISNIIIGVGILGVFLFIILRKVR
ncbi:hypothetical protein J4450_05955 [Candidatus Micrarchaeota archaeon]|nr:hypothetical protein [Candidatus Micrarchaeota archaeon]